MSEAVSLTKVPESLAKLHLTPRQIEHKLFEKCTEKQPNDNHRFNLFRMFRESGFSEADTRFISAEGMKRIFNNLNIVLSEGDFNRFFKKHDTGDGRISIANLVHRIRPKHQPTSNPLLPKEDKDLFVNKVVIEPNPELEDTSRSNSRRGRKRIITNLNGLKVTHMDGKPLFPQPPSEDAEDEEVEEKGPSRPQSKPASGGQVTVHIETQTVEPTPDEASGVEKAKEAEKKKKDKIPSGAYLNRAKRLMMGKRYKYHNKKLLFEIARAYELQDRKKAQQPGKEKTEVKRKASLPRRQPQEKGLKKGESQAQQVKSQPLTIAVSPDTPHVASGQLESDPSKASRPSSSHSHRPHTAPPSNSGSRQSHRRTFTPAGVGSRFVSKAATPSAQVQETVALAIHGETVPLQSSGPNTRESAVQCENLDAVVNTGTQTTRDKSPRAPKFTYTGQKTMVAVNPHSPLLKEWYNISRKHMNTSNEEYGMFVSALAAKVNERRKLMDKQVVANDWVS